jgi:ubiquinone/menaquinone biosynthesis C-methylase UbiE
MTNDAHDSLEMVRKGYDRWAEVYDHDANPMPALEEPLVQAAVGDPAGLEVLDLGCGTGRHTAWLAAAGARVTAVDFSPGMLAVARDRLGDREARFLQHDLHDPLPLENGSFDLVVSGLVLEHLRDLNVFFAEVNRVLRQSGRTVISAMHPAMFERGSQARFTDPESGEIVQPGSIDHSLEDISSAAIAAGFLVNELQEYAPDAAFTARFPRAQKYLDYPMLVVMVMSPEPRREP